MDQKFVCQFLLSMFLCVESFDDCLLPVPDEKVDFNMIPGRWYQIFSMNDPNQELLHCFSFRDFKVVGKDIYFTVENIHYQKDKGKVVHGYTPMHMLKQEMSYHYEKRFKYLVDDEASRLYKMEKISDKEVGKSNLEIDELFDGKLAFDTDYENYLIEFFCAPDNQRYFWVYSRNPNPSAKDLLRVHNRLGEIGKGWNKLPLFPSECSDVDQLEELPPF